MRTSINTVITNRTVFGFGQDRAVLSLNGMDAPAAQHLLSWHAGKRARDLARALKRRVSAVVAGAVVVVEQMCPTITDAIRQPVRHVSPVLVRI
jgi:hypothetical protein